MRKMRLARIGQLAGRQALAAVALVAVAATPGAAKVKISLLVDNAGGARRPLLESFLKKFNEKYPDIEVEWSEGAEPAKIFTLIAGGAAPDVIYVRGTYAQTYIDKGFLEPLSRYIRGPQGTNLPDFIPAGIQAYQRAGETYALPYDIAPVLLFYNVDMLADAGVELPAAGEWSYDDLRQIARRLTRREGERITRYGWAAPLGAGTSWQFEASWLRPWGGYLFNEDETAVRLTEEPAVRALSWWQQFAQEKISGGDLLSGTTAIQTNGVWFLANLRQAQGTRWDMAAVPSGPVARTTPLQGSGYAITKQSKHKEEAWLFLREFTGQLGMQELWGRVSMPSRRSALNDFLGDLRGRRTDAILKSVEIAVLGRPIQPPGEAAYADAVRPLWNPFIQGQMSPVEFAERAKTAILARWASERGK